VVTLRIAPRNVSPVSCRVLNAMLAPNPTIAPSSPNTAALGVGLSFLLRHETSRPMQAPTAAQGNDVRAERPRTRRTGSCLSALSPAECAPAIADRTSSSPYPSSDFTQVLTLMRAVTPVRRFFQSGKRALSGRLPRKPCLWLANSIEPATQCSTAGATRRFRIGNGEKKEVAEHTSLLCEGPASKRTCRSSGMVCRTSRY
jgi:hypothetical protein